MRKKFIASQDYQTGVVKVIISANSADEVRQKFSGFDSVVPASESQQREQNDLTPNLKEYDIDDDPVPASLIPFLSNISEQDQRRYDLLMEKLFELGQSSDSKSSPPDIRETVKKLLEDS